MARRISEMSRSARLLSLILIYALCSWSCESASVSLSPLGIVSVCPGGQVLLTCERLNGSVLFWDVSVPHLASATTNEQRIVASEGSILSPEFRIGFTEFNVTRTSESPLISELLINNVTPEINGSTIYCSDDGNETNAPMSVINNDDVLHSMDHSLNVTIVNQLLRSDDVTVTLQWLREPGAVYSVNVSPEISHTEHTSMGYSILAMNLTISYDIQYNVSIISLTSLCGVTTTKTLKYVTCDYPPIQSLHHPAAVVSGSQDSPLIEGEFITYTCPSGFILTGPNASVCMGNKEWEPDPGQVDCLADCELPLMDRSIKLNFSSTLEGSILTLTCENEILNFNMNTTETTLSVTCDSNGSWIPNPADFIQSCSPFSTTVSPTTVIPSTAAARRSRDVVIISVASSTSSFIFGSLLFLSVGLACGCHWGQRWRKILSEDSSTGSQQISEQTASPNPLYEDVFTQEQEPLEMKENAAYCSITVSGL